MTALSTCALLALSLAAAPALASGGPAPHGDSASHGESHDDDAVAEATFPSAPKTPAKTSAKTSASKPKSTAAKPAAHSEVHWDYDGELGPERWGQLSPEWAKCSSGRAQTPIDINTSFASPIGLDDVMFHYHPLQSVILNNGHTIQVNLPEGDAIEIDGNYYKLAQFHFHAPSEHRLNGKQFPMELHLVHKDSSGNLAVVGIFLEEGSEAKALAPVFSSMSIGSGQEKPIAAPLELSSFVPTEQETVRYTGSLTTPPCSEGVRWVVFTQPMSVSSTQMGSFLKLYNNNARPIQALNNRYLLQDATH